MINWVIQTSGLPEYAIDRVRSMLRAEGHSCHDVWIVEGSDRISGLETIDPDHAAVFYGSCRLVELACQVRLFPGVFFQRDLFEYSAWLSHREADMLNQRVLRLTIDQLHKAWRNPVLNTGLSEPKRRASRLKVNSLPDELFIRPTGSGKLFSGRVLKHSEFSDWHAQVTAGPRRIGADQEVLIAPVQKLRREWRFFIVDGRIVSSSQYALDGQANTSDKVPYEAVTAARRLAGGWLPQPVIAMDVGETETGEYRIVEFSCFNSSALYQCDYADVFEAVGQHIRNRFLC